MRSLKLFKREEMNTIITLCILLIFSACYFKSGERESHRSEDKNPMLTEVADQSTEAADEETPDELIIGERIDGPANIRDGINARLLFSLNDNVLVNCAPLENDWYRIGLLMDIEPGRLEIRNIKKGHIITANGEAVGEILSDIQVFPSPDDPSKGELLGFTHRGNIKARTIIEKALADFMQQDDTGRSLEVMQTFIRNFAMERTDSFEGYVVYFNYETWLDDPSPMWRIGLVFQEGKLAAILHSRPLTLPGTTGYTLARGFGCLIYKDVANGDTIVKMLSGFVGSVD